ncbi:hypothetical protein DMC30DRAFT_400779 [Rhodotorula diobovata]|uniref:Complex 1 protein-domain-containing protein n=1 Tax=Rhodotorula diobovata TaxID=5288 RepID=A0A5C5FTI7_9BASI|nr:hypothetical protein DMC30DRAFT_400779 [Rhodotorula diobovata]
MAPRRITGLQRQVYTLYKRALQLVASKPLEHRPAWFAFVSHQFRHPSLGGGLKRKDVSAIEHLMRRGDKMLETYGSPGVKKVVVPATEPWPLGWVAKGGKEGLGR